MKFDFENQTKYEINLDLLEKISQEFTDKDIELIACNNDYIQELNKQFRDKNTPTDVLSFPYDEMLGIPLGSIVISVDFVLQKSKELKHSFQDEFNLLYIHGFLHLLGFDHEVDNGEHRIREEELIKKYNLPQSLIIRNS